MTLLSNSQNLQKVENDIVIFKGNVMRDTHDTRRIPMKRRCVALYLYVTGIYSNQLTLEQWAFENGLPLFLYTLYDSERCE